MERSRSALRTGAVMLLLLSVVAGGQVAGAWQVAPPEADCPEKNGTPGAAASTPVATPTGRDVDSISHGGPVVDHVSFVDALRACGVTVDPGEAIRQPFLRAEGIVLQLHGGGLSQSVEVQSYAYEDSASAEADAAEIGPDGNPPAMMITWIGTPHFFRAERVIVLYVGGDQSTIDLLTGILGSPFVG